MITRSCNVCEANNTLSIPITPPNFLVIFIYDHMIILKLVPNQKDL